MKNQKFLIVSTLLAFVSTAQATEGGMHKVSPLLFGIDSAHLHLLTNHVPIFVTFSGLVALLLAFFWKNDVAKRTGLLVLLMGTIVASSHSGLASKPTNQCADWLMKLGKIGSICIWSAPNKSCGFSGLRPFPRLRLSRWFGEISGFPWWLQLLPVFLGRQQLELRDG